MNLVSPRHGLLATALVCLMLQSMVVRAEDFPTKPVRIITPFPVGSGPEEVLRLLADKLSRAWGKPVVVENKPGGGCAIAIDVFKHASAFPDVPTFRESGGPAGFEVSGWTVIAAPRGLSTSVTDKIQREIEKLRYA